MRRIHLALGFLSLMTAGAIGAAACGSDDPAAIAPPPDGGASSSSTTSSSSSSSGDPGTTTSSSSSSGADPDSGGSTTSSSGNVASNPTKISCGAVECDAGGGGGNIGGLCCVRDGGTNPVCLRLNQANQCDNSPNANTLQLTCDETGDCPKTGDGQVRKCCLAREGDVNASCGLTCGGGGGEPALPQLCKTDAECSDGGANQPTCTEKTCRNFKIRVCGTPTGCN